MPGTLIRDIVRQQTGDFGAELFRPVGLLQDVAMQYAGFRLKAGDPLPTCV